MKLIHVIGLMICLSILMIGSVSALEMYEDELTVAPSFVSSSYSLTAAGADTGYYCVTTIAAKNIQNTAGTSTLIHFDVDITHKSVYAAGAPSAAETPFTLSSGATVIGTGTFGYQRLYNDVGTEQAGYQYLLFDTWNISGQTGDKVLTLNFNKTEAPIGNMRAGTWAAYTPTPPTGYLSWGEAVEAGGHAAKTTTYNKATAFANSYSVTKGLGLGIVGTIWKYGLTDTTIYNSRAFVYNATSNSVVASDSSVNDDDLHFNLPVSTIYIAILDADDQWHNTSTLFTTSPASSDVTYAINLNPTIITSTTSTSATISANPSSSLLEITDAAWSWSDGTGEYDFYENGNVSRPMDYTKIGSTWYGYEVGSGGIGGGYTRNKGTSLPNPVSLSNVSSTGEKLVTCFIGTTDGYWYSLTSVLTVSSGGMQTLIVEATDAYSNALVSYANINILDKSSNIWINVTAPYGTYNFLYPYSANLYIEGVATGYATTSKNWTVLPYNSYIMKLPMFPTGTIAAGNVSLNVVVLEGSTSGVFSNAQVRLSDGQVKITSAVGVATFNVSATKSYSIIASYPGYNSATRTLTTGAGGTSQDTYLTLSRIVVTTSPTLPPGVTAVVTLDTRTDLEKDKAMMKQIRDFAPTLITLAMLMTALYIVGYKP